MSTQSMLRSGRGGGFTGYGEGTARCFTGFPLTRIVISNIPGGTTTTRSSTGADLTAAAVGVFMGSSGGTTNAAANNNALRTANLGPDGPVAAIIRAVQSVATVIYTDDIPSGVSNAGAVAGDPATSWTLWTEGSQVESFEDANPRDTENRDGIGAMIQAALRDIGEHEVSFTDHAGTTQYVRYNFGGTALAVVTGTPAFAADTNVISDGNRITVNAGGYGDAGATTRLNGVYALVSGRSALDQE